MNRALPKHRPPTVTVPQTTPVSPQSRQPSTADVERFPRAHQPLLPAPRAMHVQKKVIESIHPTTACAPSISAPPVFRPSRAAPPVSPVAFQGMPCQRAPAAPLHPHPGSPLTGPAPWASAHLPVHGRTPAPPPASLAVRIPNLFQAKTDNAHVIVAQLAVNKPQAPRRLLPSALPTNAPSTTVPIPVFPAGWNVIQRAAGGSDKETEPPKAAKPLKFADSETIGARAKRRADVRNAKSPRLKAAAAREDDDPTPGPASAVRGSRVARSSPYTKSKEKGIWNPGTRPSFEDSTWDTVWARDGRDEDSKGVRQFKCTECGKLCYRQRDKPAQERRLDATLDHRMDWQNYIETKGAPNDDGEVTSQGAKVAYNDIKNLVVMCRSCNSSKNGPKGNRA